MIMPAAAHTAAIAFGLVFIPVKLYTAVSEDRTSFNQLHVTSHARIRYKKVREDTGEEVKPEEIVRGYQYEKDRYVIFTDEELERMKTPKDKAINIISFISPASVSPLYYDKLYYVVPDGSNKAYALLNEAMKRQNVSALASTVIGTNETLLTISPMDNGLVAQTLYYQNEIKAMPVPVMAGNIQISEQEMNMASMLIQNMSGGFQPESYHNTYQMKLQDAIQAKIQGREIAMPQEQQGNAFDLMEALQRSLAR